MKLAEGWRVGRKDDPPATARQVYDCLVWEKDKKLSFDEYIKLFPSKELDSKD